MSLINQVLRNNEDRTLKRTLSHADGFMSEQVSVDDKVEIEPIIGVASSEYLSLLLRLVNPYHRHAYQIWCCLKSFRSSTPIWRKFISKDRKIVGVHADELKQF